jgi:translation initiation factor eIF-2B subunit gamma
MDFQVVVLAGGTSDSEKLSPLVSKVVSPLPFFPPSHLTSSMLVPRLNLYLSFLLSTAQDVPKALLPVANRPVLSYALDLLEASDLKDLIVVSSSLFCFSSSCHGCGPNFPSHEQDIIWLMWCGAGG